jgi:DNA repair protein RadC
MNKLPREKLIEDGIDKLTDDELLAIMLGVGTKNEDVFTMSKRLIKDYGFSHLLRMDYLELSKIPGIKEAKATKLISVFEIA